MVKENPIGELLQNGTITEADLAEAMVEAASRLTIKFDGDLGSVEDMVRKLNLRIVDDGSTSQPKQPVVTSQLVQAYLESRTGGISKGSLTSYRHTLNVFARHCPVMPDHPAEIEKYLARFKEPRSAASVYTVIKLLYEFAETRFGVFNVMNLIQRPRFKQKEVFSLSLDEAKAVINSCQTTRERALVHLYLGHGLRLEEGVRMNICDIEDGQMLVRGKMRTEYMPLLPESRDILMELAKGRDPNEPVFMSRQHNRLHHKQAYNIIKANMVRAGVMEGRSVDSRIATHTLRKSFSTLAYHAGCDGRTIERLLRHMKRDMTSLYVGMPMNNLRKYLERYSPIRLLNESAQDKVAESIA